MYDIKLLYIDLLSCTIRYIRHLDVKYLLYFSVLKPSMRYKCPDIDIGEGLALQVHGKIIKSSATYRNSAKLK